MNPRPRRGGYQVPRPQTWISLLQLPARALTFGLLVVALALEPVEYANSAHGQPLAAIRIASTEGKPVAVIQTYKGGLAGVRSANAAIRLSIGRDPSGPDEPVLFMEYPAPSDDPAGRDVQCDAENHDWTAGHAISFRVKPDHAVRLSLSFLDRNRIAYTYWTDLQGGIWQSVRVPFDQIRPNPYFQPPNAKIGAPMDVSQVSGIAFAPHDQTSGRLTIGRFVVVK